MQRRDFIKGMFAGTLGSMFAGNVLAARDEGKIFNQNVCRTLDGLKDYNTGEPFQHDGKKFVLAYFCTPYQKYQGCSSDVLYIYQAAQSMPERILPVMVFSSPENGDPDSRLAQTYTSSVNGTIRLKGLHGEKQDVLAAAKSYKSHFITDRHTGKIVDHSRATVLISPSGDLLAKYTPEQMQNVATKSMMGEESHLADQIKSYDKGKIIPASPACTT